MSSARNAPTANDTDAWPEKNDRLSSDARWRSSGWSLADLGVGARAAGRVLHHAGEQVRPAHRLHEGHQPVVGVLVVAGKQRATAHVPGQPFAAVEQRRQHRQQVGPSDVGHARPHPLAHCPAGTPSATGGRRCCSGSGGPMPGRGDRTAGAPGPAGTPPPPATASATVISSGEKFSVSGTRGASAGCAQACGASDAGTSRNPDRADRQDPRPGRRRIRRRWYPAPTNVPVTGSSIGPGRGRRWRSGWWDPGAGPRRIRRWLPCSGPSPAGSGRPAGDRPARCRPGGRRGRSASA